MAAERELADILLTELLPRGEVREGIGAGLPDGWRLVDLYDVWLGAPALAGQVVGGRLSDRARRGGRAAT